MTVDDGVFDLRLEEDFELLEVVVQSNDSDVVVLTHRGVLLLEPDPVGVAD